MHRYQNLLDRRLSQPKNLQAKEHTRDSDRKVYYRNSSPTQQLAHQEVSYKRNRMCQSACKMRESMKDEIAVREGSYGFHAPKEAYG